MNRRFQDVDKVGHGLQRESLSLQASTIHFQHFFEKIKETCYNIKRNRDTGNGPPLRFSVGPLFAYDRA